MEDKIKNLIKDFVGDVHFVVEHSANMSFGDYSTNAGIISKKPVDLLEYLQKNKPREIEKIDAKSGFINFYLSDEFFGQSVKEISKEKENFDKNNSLSSQKIIVEHTDPNPFKEFHIGHLMPNVVGSTVARIMAWNGGEVKEACYQGDVGMHVAKAVWALLKGTDIKEAYAAGHRVYEGDENAKKEIQEINKKIYEKSDEKINEVYEAGRKESLQDFAE